MKNAINLSFIFFLFTLFGFGQNDSIKRYGWSINAEKVLKNQKQTLYVLNGYKVDKEAMDVIEPRFIDNVNVFKNPTATVIYGDDAENGAILITTKDISETELKKIYDLYEINKVKSRYNNKFTYQGIVKDCDSIVLPGVEVVNLNTDKRTTSDFNGKFSIKSSINDVIKFSYIGFENKRILIQNKDEVTIFLKQIPYRENTQILVKKPVIYLYPEKTTEVDFKFNFKGKLLTTFPKYDTSWKITAYSDGKIFDKKTNRFYNSLFWDGEMSFPSEHYNYKSGFVVAKKDLTSFLIQKLEHIGLNTNETNDFIQFWLPILEKNELNFIHFLVNSDYDCISTNDINPKPDTNLRVFMEFYGLEHDIQIEEQKLSKTNRIGFTLVEWGGSDVSQNCVNKNNILK